MAQAANNTNLLGFISQMNNNQVRTQTMFALNPWCPDTTIQSVIDHIQVYGQGFTVPNRTNEFADISYRGYPVPVPTVLKMEQTHTCTLNCDTRMNLRGAFLQWQAQQINPAISQGSYFQSDRRPTELVNWEQEPFFDIDLLAPDYQTIVEEIRLHGVRVESVGSVTLSNTDGGVATFEVGFRSVYWETMSLGSVVDDIFTEADRQNHGSDNGSEIGWSAKLDEIPVETNNEANGGGLGQNTAFGLL